MRSEVPINLLKSHPRNEEYFSALSPEKHEEIRRSIETHGIRDPLKVLPDYTVVAGHQRLRIAQELGMEKVPVVVLDISQEEAEYLLIADNEERRQSDEDPIRKAKRAAFLKQYWGVREGSANPKGVTIPREGKNYPHDGKTLSDIAKAVGESRENLKKLLKLNDLTPSLQALVSQRRLPQTAAYSLAFLPPEEQESLLRALGESGICGLSVKDAQALRSDLDLTRAEKEKLRISLIALEKEKTALSEQLSVAKDIRPAQDDLTNLRRQLLEKQAETDILRTKLDELVQNPVEKVIYKLDPVVTAELEAAKKRTKELLGERESLTERLVLLAEDRAVKEDRLTKLESKRSELEEYLDHARKEIEKLKSRPRPKLDQRRVNCHALMEKASISALTLADVLKSLENDYADDLLSVARVRGGQEIEEIATSILDAGLFTAFNTSLETVMGRIDCVAEIIRVGKPKLRIIKNTDA
jgi:ParB family chromosome partitioning protein